MNKDKSLDTIQSNQKYNFFNLDSESDEESDETTKKIQEDIEKKIQKWDWDRAENLDLYFKHSYETKKSSKRSLLLDESEGETRNSNKKFNESVKESSHNLPYIETSECNTTLSMSNNSVFKLIGHKSSVNRINWCRKPENKNVLLSSSMDG